MSPDADASVLTAALRETVARVATSQVDAAAIRGRYFAGGFDMANAHRAWTAALGLKG